MNLNPITWIFFSKNDNTANKLLEENTDDFFC